MKICPLPPTDTGALTSIVNYDIMSCDIQNIDAACVAECIDRIHERKGERGCGRGRGAGSSDLVHMRVGGSIVISIIRWPRDVRRTVERRSRLSGPVASHQVLLATLDRSN